jgi:Flp pilus assembly protein TadB
MMYSNAVEKPAHLSETQQMTRDAGNLMSRKIWLPKTLYNILPYFYLCAGIGALLATMYISGWVWVLPHYLLFAVACLHMGLLVYRRRNKPKP